MIGYNNKEHRVVIQLDDNEEDRAFGQSVVRVHKYVKEHGHYDCGYYILKYMGKHRTTDEDGNEYWDNTIKFDKTWSYLHIKGDHIREDGPDEWSLMTCTFNYGSVEFDGLDLTCVEPNKTYRVGEWLEIVLADSVEQE